MRPRVNLNSDDFHHKNPYRNSSDWQNNAMFSMKLNKSYYPWHLIAIDINISIDFRYIKWLIWLQGKINVRQTHWLAISIDILLIL